MINVYINQHLLINYFPWHANVYLGDFIHAALEMLFRSEKSPAPPAKIFPKERSVGVLFVYLNLTGNYGSELYRALS